MTESAAVLHHALRVARSRGVDLRGLDEQLGLDLSRPADLIRRLPVATVLAAWRDLIALPEAGSIPFRAATTPFPEATALHVFVVTSRATLGEALEVLVGLSPIVTAAVRFELELSTSAAVVRVQARPGDRAGMAAVEEFYVAHLAHAVRFATGGRWRPQRVSFRHDHRQDAGAPECLGGVEYGAPETRIVLDLQDRHLPLDLFDSLAMLLATRVGTLSMVARARSEIALMLSAKRRDASRLMSPCSILCRSQLHLGVECHVADRGPVAGVARPSARRSGARRAIDLVALGEDRDVAQLVPVVGGDVPDAAVEVLAVVPGDELSDPLARVLERREGLSREAGAVLQRAEERLADRIVVADAGAAEGGNDAEALERREHGRALHGTAVVGVEN